MRANQALEQSAARLIVADTNQGLVTIYHEYATATCVESFHVRFLPCDEHGFLNQAGTVLVGSYDDLDTALTIAAIRYGARESAWRPAKSAETQASHAHSPNIQGRSISQEEEDEGVTGQDRSG